MTKWIPDLEDRDRPIFRAIANAIEEAVAQGDLSPGDQLPTQRALADQLGVTVGTVGRAYQEAEDRGLLMGQVGRGTFVQRPRTEGESWISDVGGAEDGMIDLSANFPPPDEEAGQALATALRGISQERELDWLLRYQKSFRAPLHHRRAGVTWLEARGLHVRPGEVLVAAGAQHALTAAFAVLTRPNDLVLSAATTYPGFRTIARMFSVRVQGVTMDEEGIVPDDLARRCEKEDVKLLYVIPTLQNPTVATMSSARRKEVAEVCTAHDVLILEDDIHAPLVPEAPAPIAHHAPETACYISSLSKAVAPGLRTAYVVPPPTQASRIQDGIRATIWMPPPLCIEVVSRWIESGYVEDLVARRRNLISERNRLASEILGGIPHRSSEYSMHLWLYLPDQWSAREFALAAEARGVRLSEASAFSVEPTQIPSAVRICLGAPTENDDVEEALYTIRRLMDEGPTPTLTTV